MTDLHHVPTGFARPAWEGDVPVSVQHADPYYARADGLAEARHVFLAGNDLPARFRPGFAIAELGFGTGLNVLAAWTAWRAAAVQGPLRVVSFEIAPMACDDMARAHAAFPELAAMSAALLRDWPTAPDGALRLALDDLELTVIVGDVRDTLPAWRGVADAWFLDGFAPARNTEMWGADVLDCLARRTAPGGTVATYSAAGHVRRALETGGFDVARVSGWGAKRHMTRAGLRADAARPEGAGPRRDAPEAAPSRRTARAAPAARPARPR